MAEIVHCDHKIVHCDHKTQQNLAAAQSEA